MKKLFISLISFAVLTLTNFAGAAMEENYYLPGLKRGEYYITIPDFTYGGKIPVEYTCKGKDISPHIIWKNPPKKTKSFVLIVDDPDAPSKIKIWDHWILYDIPAKVRELPKDIKLLPKGTKVAVNSWGKSNYGGPCPPKGDRPHRYYFTLFALDKEKLEVSGKPTKKEIYKAMETHILAEANWMGKFGVEGY